jgi:hypothetical protein
MSQILNRISLGLAKHERILKTLNRPSGSSSSTPSITNPRSSSTSGFSSLSGAAAPPPSFTGTPAALTTATRKDEEALFLAERALAPNAGVGYAPLAGEEKSAEAKKGDQMLRGRLLGKSARGQKDKGAKKRYLESESEVEVGRSGVGKKKWRRATAAEPHTDDERLVGGGRKEKGVNEDVGARAVSMAAGDGDVVVREAVAEERSGPEAKEAGVGAQPESGEADAVGDLEAKKTRRKKAKKKRKSKAKNLDSDTVQNGTSAA